MNEHERDGESARRDEREAERDQRDAERDEREAEREQRWAERDAEREARHAAHEARREERRRRHGWGEFLSETLGERIRDEISRSLGDAATFGEHIRDEIRGAAAVDEEGGPRSDEVIEHRFALTGMPHVTVRNVSGETQIHVGEPGEVFVRARKRVHGWSVERARRMLENVEIRFEQSGDEILIEPRLYEQERGWLDLFRGGRVAVDLDVRVPREAHIQASTVSGDLSLRGTRGPTELRSVSGEIEVEDVQGPMRVRSVSGDIDVTSYAGQIEANTVSGEVRFERSRCRAPDVVTVSGDVELDGLLVPAGGAESRVKTVSGDVDLSFADPNVEVEFRSTSGDAELEGPGRVEKEGRRDRRIVIGGGTGHIRVKTVSGDLCCRVSHSVEGEPAPSAAAESSIPTASEAAASPSPAARDVLDRLARGELSVDEAAAALDASRGD